MKKYVSILTTVCFALGATLSASNTAYADYQNYNQGYPPAVAPGGPTPCGAPVYGPGPCATCGPCDPCAPVCGTDCGVSICAIGLGVVAVAAAAAIIIASGNGSSTSH